MNNSNKKNLEQLIAKHGQSIIKDKMRCESLIRDYYIGSILQRNLLIQSLKIGIPQELLSNQKNPQLELILRRSISNMQNSYGIKDELANWIIETWKKVLMSPHTPQKKTIAQLGKPAELIINFGKNIPPELAIIPAQFIIDLGKNIPLELVIIPAGKFMMGSLVHEKNRYANEKQNEVTLTKSYCLGKYPVIQEQWEGIMGNNPSKKKGAKLPITDISWDHCQEFIRKLNAKIDGRYRLPTEAEWEYACRAGTSTAYSVGNSLTEADANIHVGIACIHGGMPTGIKAAGSYKPNAFGLYDMHGNVWEWCEDRYGDYPSEPVTDPKGPTTGDRRVLRGGSFNYDDSVARSSHRNYYMPSVRVSSFGFRLARTP